MGKRKNEIVAAWQKRAKRLAVTLILLGVVSLGAGVAYLSSPSHAYDVDAIAEYISFPTEARIFEPVCLSIGGLGDSRTATGFLADQDVWATEIYMDGWRVPSYRFKAELIKSLPATARWCYPYGLARGEHLMGLRLKTAAGEEIAVYDWHLMVDQELWSDAKVESKIAQLAVQEQYMPQRAEGLQSITRTANAYEPICVTTTISSDAFKAPGFVESYKLWSDVRINGVKVSPDDIQVTPNTPSNVVTLCFDGLAAGTYVARVIMPDTTLGFSYEWVLTVIPGEKRGGCGRDH